MLTHSYHTHTFRCNHADGTERQYVEEAIRGGMKALGFSDHAPYVFEGDYYSHFRMRPEQMEDYVRTILDLRDEYASDIEIHLGLEAEYYPRFFEGFMRLIEPYPIEYVILGQHFLFDELEQVGTLRGTDRPDYLKAYREQTIEAINTGAFTYFAHPDIFLFRGDGALYEENMRLICQAAKERSLPLEINLLGIRSNRTYPNETFWRIAGEVGNVAVVGSDAHRAQDVCDNESFEKALRMMQKYGLTFQKEPRMIAPGAERR